MKIGSFSAASNVTGIVTDVDQVAITLHRHGALSCWDYAAAGPYLPIDMNAAPEIPDGPLAYKDAVFLSPHKFVGGPGTPGVLVAKRSLLRNRVPSVPGGGTILFVSPTGHCLPPRPGDPRGGRHARRSSSRSAPGSRSRSRRRSAADEIRRREHDFARRALRVVGARTRRSRSSATPSSSASRSSRSACATRAGLLHANFVVAVLSDLFGIQARSGCFCAGPYIHRMYPIDDEWSRRMDAEVGQGPPGRQARVHAAQLQLLHQRGRLRLHRRRRPPARRRGLEAAAALPLRSRHRPVAPPRRRARAAAEPARLRRGARRRAGAPAPPRPRACSPASSRRRGGSSRAVAGARRRRARCTTRRSARSSSGSAGSRSRARGSRSC